ncbi:MAG: hypothetical protein JJ992_16380 [Planctomycetes bacterium]|nr:hypothetical protein [Planctomycetota bacterium]
MAQLSRRSLKIDFTGNFSAVERVHFEQTSQLGEIQGPDLRRHGDVGVRLQKLQMAIDRQRRRPSFEIEPLEDEFFTRFIIAHATLEPGHLDSRIVAAEGQLMQIGYQI